MHSANKSFCDAWFSNTTTLISIRQNLKLRKLTPFKNTYRELQTLFDLVFNQISDNISRILQL